MTEDAKRLSNDFAPRSLRGASLRLLTGGKAARSHGQRDAKRLARLAPRSATSASARQPH